MLADKVKPVAFVPLRIFLSFICMINVNACCLVCFLCKKVSDYFTNGPSMCFALQCSFILGFYIDPKQ